MISYVKLKNFISFGDVTFDLRKNKDFVKNFAAVYGENGSGKTNFIKSVQFLVKSIISLKLFTSMPNIMGELASVIKRFDKETRPELEEASKYFFGSIVDYLGDCRMRECSESTEVEYGFKYNERNGIYRIKFKESITEETLYYWTGKQSGYLFKIFLDNNGKIASKIDNVLAGNDLKSELNEAIERYWGKHTLLSIISYQLSGQNKDFTKGNYSQFLLDVLDCFSRLNVYTKDGEIVGRALIGRHNDSVLVNLCNGTITKEDLIALKRSELFVGDILSQCYADIKGVEYEIEPLDDKLSYRLIINKIIAGKVRKIPVSNESTGTRRILNNLVPFINAMDGNIVFIDEADTGIHDILFNNILQMVRDKITGQLVITTHNTTLLENIDPKSAYFITVDYKGNKEAVCMDEYGIQKSNNPRTLYLKGLFGGVPVLDPIDGESIFADLGKESGELFKDVDAEDINSKKSASRKKEAVKRDK